MNFDGYAFRQMDKAPIQVTFVAPSSAIDSWAKVPTKMSNRPGNFQRAQIPGHIKEVRDFFEDPSRENCSPTAILLGIQPNDRERVRLLDANGKQLNGDDIGSDPVPCKIVVDFEPWSPAPYAGDLDAEIEAVFTEVRELYESVPASDESEYDEDGDDEEDDEQDLSLIESEAEDDADDDLEDEADLHPEGELALTQTGPREILAAVDSGTFRSWDQEKKRRLRDQLKDDRKIGIIIDGQHRVKGTASQGRIPFIVSLLPDADWAELAFQFIVNNGTAKKVDEGLLIAIVGHSLKPTEVAQTEGRLYRSGIKVSLIQAVMRVQNEENPFNGMLKFGYPGESGFLEAPAMQKKVVSKWYGSRGRSGQKPRFPNVRLSVEPKRSHWNLGNAFGGVCAGSNAEERARDWQDNKWFLYFRAFWEAVSAHFLGDLWPASQEQWPVGSKGQESVEVQKIRRNLMRVTVLGLLQSAVLDAWWRFRVKQWKMEEHEPGEQFTVSVEQFGKQIRQFVRNVPAAFFTELDYTGFDASKDLRGDFQEQLLKLLDGHDEFANMRTSHKFWQGQ